MSAKTQPFQRKGLPAHLKPEAVVALLEEQDRDAHEALAVREDAPPEALYFIATEGSAVARRAVAANPHAPVQANRLLADDADDDVRAELARKIGRLIPNLPSDASEKMRALTIETLERLARDQLPKVRAILAQEIKHLDCIPKHVVTALARDVEYVSAPILQYSPLLSDADLAEIVSTAQASYVLVAIAKRQPLTANISDAIAEALCVPAISSLLANSRAEIRQQTLEKIVENGANVKEWHLPLVMRSELSQRAIRRLAGFVGASLIERLADRHGLDEQTRSILAKKMRGGLNAGSFSDGNDPGKRAFQEVERLFSAGELTDSVVEHAAAAGRREFIISALSCLAKLPPDNVRRILEAGTAKPVTALVWSAGLSMRTSFKIQTLVMRLAAHELLPARGGIDFPLSEVEMRWHLNYFAANPA